MPTCGYVCPACEGTGFNKETMESCEWCSQKPVVRLQTITDDEWIEAVHTKNCCSDVGSIDFQEISN